MLGVGNGTCGYDLARYWDHTLDEVAPDAQVDGQEEEREPEPQQLDEIPGD